MSRKTLLERDTNAVDLTGVFEAGVGYHSAAWIEVSDNGEVAADRDIADPLRLFLGEVAAMVKENPERVLGRIGVAYMRVIDGRSPENYMKWHVDNPDGANRFHTAVSTDGSAVNLAWPEDESLIGHRVDETDWSEAYQPNNGVIVGFTTEPHGVLPQAERPGQATAIYFATLYQNRQDADLYTTNNTQTGSHAMLPTLEDTRYTLPFENV